MALSAETATVHTMDSRHRYRRYANLVAGQQFDAPDQCWVADLTYIRLPGEFVYLAALLDRYSRKCIGWNLGRGLDSSLSLGALGYRPPTEFEPLYSQALLS